MHNGYNHRRCSIQKACVWHITKILIHKTVPINNDIFRYNSNDIQNIQKLSINTAINIDSVYNGLDHEFSSKEVINHKFLKA